MYSARMLNRRDFLKSASVTLAAAPVAGEEARHAAHPSLGEIERHGDDPRQLAVLVGISRRGGEEGLMCNYRGELSECAQANFFMVRGGVVLTPPSGAGLLEGITRAFIFEVGRGERIEVRDEVLYPKDLQTADEAFITSTTRELSPVVSIDGKPIGDGKVGAVTTRLLDGYRRKAQELTSATAARR